MLIPNIRVLWTVDPENITQVSYMVIKGKNLSASWWGMNVKHKTLKQIIGSSNTCSKFPWKMQQQFQTWPLCARISKYYGNNKLNHDKTHQHRYCIST